MSQWKLKIAKATEYINNRNKNTTFVQANIMNMSDKF